jgi:tetratricopeptide (TPR) repeat protein
MKAYDLGHFDEAVREFEAAYDADDSAAYLFNIAQAYRRGHNETKALELYKTYLRKAPDAADRASVESIIAEIEKTISETAPPPAAAAPPAPAPAPAAVPAPAPAPRVAVPSPPIEQEHPGRGLKIAGITTAAVGLAACGVGIAFAFQAKSKDDQSGSSPVYNPQLEKDADSARTMAYVFFGVGGAAVVAGAILAIVGWTSHGSAAAGSGAPPVASVQPMIAPNLAGLVFAGAF